MKDIDLVKTNEETKSRVRAIRNTGKIEMNSDETEKTDKARTMQLLEFQRRGKKRLEFDIKSRPSLEGTILESFDVTEDFFIFYSDRLYTHGYVVKDCDGNDRGKIIYNRTEILLEESEDFARIEQMFFEKNKNNIENFKERVLDELLERYNRSEKAISDLRESIERRFSLPDFILNEIFTLYNRRKSKALSNRSKIDMMLNEKKDFKKTIPDTLNIDSFSDNKSCFLKLIEDESSSIKKGKINGVIGFFGHVYGFYSKDVPIINLDSLSESLVHLGTFKEFNKRYKKYLSDKVEEKVKELFSERICFLKRNEAKVDLVRKMSNISARKKEDGEIGFEKISEGEYTVYKKLPRFIMKKNGNYYMFPKAKIATVIYANESALKVKVPGFICESYYKHPFTRSNGGGRTNLCHGSLDWDVFGIHAVNHGWQRFSDLKKNNFAGQVLTVLDGLEKILTMGCTGNFVPYTHITPDNFGDEHISKEKAYKLIRSGIKLYDNDDYSSKYIRR